MSQIATDKFISEGNVRATETINTADFKSLKANIKKVGILQPLLYRVNEKGDFVLRDGHQRLEIAKQLKLETVPAYKGNGEIDDVTIQISANMMRVASTPFDGAYAIQQLVDKGIVKNRKQLSAHFGKSIAWVDEALSFCNLQSNIYNAIRDYINHVGPLNIDQLASIKSISKSSVGKQEDMLLELLGCDYDDISHCILDTTTSSYEFTNLLDDLANMVKPRVEKWEIIKDVIGEETFREHEANHEVKHVFQSSLFEEFAKDEFCEDKDFLKEVFCTETPIGQWLMDNEISSEQHYTDSHRLLFNWKHKLSTFKSSLVKKMSNLENRKVKFSELNFEFWDGDVYAPAIFVFVEDVKTEPIKESDNENDDVAEDYEEAPNDNKVEEKVDIYKKFRTRAYTFLDDKCNEYLSTVMIPMLEATDSNHFNIVLKWIVQDLNRHVEIGQPSEWTWDKKEYHPCLELQDSNLDSKSPLDNHSLINKMAYYWFEEHYESASISHKDLLLEYNNKICFQDWFTAQYVANEDIRKNWINIFTKDLLTQQTGVTAKTKSEMVDAIVMSDGLTKSITCSDLLDQLL